MAQPKNFERFDYRVACDDFLLYELGRLVEEDRASLDDEVFRRVIDAGIHEHIERRVDVRADMARHLRANAARTQSRLLAAIEDIESPLHSLPEILRSYTAYMFGRLEECADVYPDERLTAAADALLDSPEDRALADAAIEALGSSRSAVGARVLAHVISEPMLEEDLELKAYNYARALWPLCRLYILYSLKPHTHEDLPYRWFQLLVDCDEPSAVERILEEMLVHGTDARYREDLVALIELLHKARDPDREAKVLQLLNSDGTPREVVDMLERLLKDTKAQSQVDTKAGGPWASLDRIYAANRKYLAAAKLFDRGKRAEAARALDEILKEEPYPFAVMLKSLV